MSSAKPINKTQEEGVPKAGDGDGVALKLRPVASAQHWLFLLGIMLLGWFRILASYDWSLTASSTFLMLGWAAILLTFVFLWNGTMTLIQPPKESDAFGLDRDFRAELEHEKNAVLKAIKEIEFDRESGKMSDTDADDVVRVYRMRAIDLLKELESMDAGKTVTAKDVIDREVRARLKLLGVTQAAKKRAEKAATKTDSERAEA